MANESLADSPTNMEKLAQAHNILKELAQICFRRNVYGRVGVHFEVKDGTAVEVIKTSETRTR